MGNVEGRDIYEGHVRVVICDGFVGNVLLKAGEGAVEFLFSTLKEELARLMPILPGDAGPKIAASLKRLKTRFEYEEFGGGPLLGIRGACIICHGASGARAIKNALRVAGTMAEDRLGQRIVEQLAGLRRQIRATSRARFRHDRPGVTGKAFKSGVYRGLITSMSSVQRSIIER